MNQSENECLHSVRKYVLQFRIANYSFTGSKLIFVGKLFIHYSIQGIQESFSKHWNRSVEVPICVAIKQRPIIHLAIDLKTHAAML